MIRSNLDNLIACLYETGVINWAVSPGSRNAPIIAAMLRHGGFELHSFPDERSAAYAAMGMAMSHQYTAGVICTSGTAVLNLYPGICEAYYQRIPLLAITADRPEELIDQWDGQTIRQKNIFEKHILNSFETPQNLHDKNHFHAIQEIVFDAVLETLTPVKGPVHINVPLREPIYKEINVVEDNQNQSKLPAFVFKRPEQEELDLAVLHAQLSKYQKILIVGGQHRPSNSIHRALAEIASRIPVLADITSNQSSVSVEKWETGLPVYESKQNLQPDLLISFGMSVTSKDLKSFLRSHKPKTHWQISDGGFTGDQFETNPEIKNIMAAEFFDNLAALEDIGNEEYLQIWNQLSIAGKQEYAQRIEKQDAQSKEMQIVQSIMGNCDQTVAIHLGNSMAVRYAGWVGKTEARIYCNRGTSGIDGTVSTAVGFAKANPEQRCICLLGDIAFFYDSNGLWCSDFPKNLSIVILNNHGGKIFNKIQGPRNFPALLPWITTPHHLSGRHIAEMHQLAYQNIGTDVAALINLLEDGKTQIIEAEIHEQ